VKPLAQWGSGASRAILDEPDHISKSAANHARTLDLLREEEGGNSLWMLHEVPCISNLLPYFLRPYLRLTIQIDIEQVCIAHISEWLGVPRIKASVPSGKYTVTSFYIADECIRWFF
jgi:hypothetical protein